MGEELKPCPFCGSNAELKRHAGKWTVSCMSEADCHGQVDIGENGLNGWESSLFATTSWNERAPRTKGRTDAAPGMSDGELIARSICSGIAFLAHALAPDVFNDAAREEAHREALLVDAELDRRAALRKEAKP